MLRKLVALFCLTVLLAGCVTMPSSPSVMALPGHDRTYEDFRRDDLYCRQMALTPHPSSPEAETAKAALITAGLGAAAGALIGVATGSPASGAAIGGASGGLLGAAGGGGAAHRMAQARQQEINQSFSACMWSFNHLIPQTPVMSR